MSDDITFNNTITVLKPKVFGLNKLYRLIIDKNRIYGVYLDNQLTSIEFLEETISGIFALISLFIFNNIFPFSASQATSAEWAKHLFIFVIFILAGRQLLGYLFQFLRPYLVKIEKSKHDKYEQVVAHSQTLIDTPDLFLQQNKHNFIVERKDLLGVEINDKYDYWVYPEAHSGQIIINAKNMTKKFLIKEVYPSEVREIFKNQSWQEF